MTTRKMVRRTETTEENSRVLGPKSTTSMIEMTKALRHEYDAIPDQTWRR